MVEFWTPTCSSPYRDMFIAAGEHLKAIEIIGDHGWVDKYVSNGFLGHKVVC